MLCSNSENMEIIYLPRNSSKLQSESKRVQSKISINGGQWAVRVQYPKAATVKQSSLFLPSPTPK